MLMSLPALAMGLGGICIVVYCIITIVTCFMYSETNTLSRFPCVKLWSCNFMLENKTNY